MSHASSTPPEFASPPVVEVALGIQFDPLVDLHTPRLGLLWKRFRDRFPRIEERSLLEPSVEQFSDAPSTGFQLRLEALDVPPPPRLWFISEDGTQLLQVQRDRFVYNWRKVTDTDPYPRYSQMRETFAGALDELRRYLEEEKVGPLVPNQCEVTYVDAMVSGAGWDRHAQLDRILTIWSSQTNDAFLPEPEDVTLLVRYIIPSETGEPLGRLRMTLHPSRHQPSGRPSYLLRTTAQGRPLAPGLDGVFRFLDIGHEWAVRGFLSVTTQRMHRIWEGKDAPDRP